MFSTLGKRALAPACLSKLGLNCQVSVNRNMAATAADPIQQIYLDKIKEYSTKVKSGAVPQDPAMAAKLADEKKKLKDIYSRNPYAADQPDDPTKPPTFAFKDPNLKDIF
ncbi:ATP synthase peripheral stalk subunit F6, mitochondrial-like [Convolutriloba macropyga]|uniref:ATP synthase peripheral stalk subunit F6, mitochondrial-like n=1 Tax=Convolutriloba macropyga TaxID=536237 RepID=UPI003F526ED1